MLCAPPLALAIGAMHLGIGIDKFLIVGGFAKALGEEYRTALVEMCHELTWEAGQKWDDMIELGREGIDEGVLGAACYGAQCVVEGQVEC